MTDLRQAAQQALEALKGVLDDNPKVLEASISGGLYEVVQCRDAITALRTALEQQAEPVAQPCQTCEALARTVMFDQTSHDAQRKPLTEQEIGAILEDINAFGTRLYTFARAIEAAHGIKENT